MLSAVGGSQTDGSSYENRGAARRHQFSAPLVGRRPMGPLTKMVAQRGGSNAQRRWWVADRWVLLRKSWRSEAAPIFSAVGGSQTDGSSNENGGAERRLQCSAPLVGRRPMGPPTKIVAQRGSANFQRRWWVADPW